MRGAPKIMKPDDGLRKRAPYARSAWDASPNAWVCSRNTAVPAVRPFRQPSCPTIRPAGLVSRVGGPSGVETTAQSGADWSALRPDLSDLAADRAAVTTDIAQMSADGAAVSAATAADSADTAAIVVGTAANVDNSATNANSEVNNREHEARISRTTSRMSRTEARMSRAALRMSRNAGRKSREGRSYVCNASLYLVFPFMNVPFQG